MLKGLIAALLFIMARSNVIEGGGKKNILSEESEMLQHYSTILSVTSRALTRAFNPNGPVLFYGSVC